MAKTMKISACISSVAALLTAVIYRFVPAPFLLSLAITFGTVAYHLDIRLVVGGILDKTMKNRANYRAWWFRPRSFEPRLYRFLRVKSWKGKMPTYRSAYFSTKEHTLEEIVQAMCQAELVHEINVFLSFLPLFTVRFFGSLTVFLLTSLAAACFDMLFVIMQRFNRPRIVRIIDRQK